MRASILLTVGAAAATMAYIPPIHPDKVMAAHIPRASACSPTVTFYLDANYKGDQRNECVLFDTCVNIDGDFNDVVSSVKLGTAVSCTLYVDKNCGGNSVGLVQDSAQLSNDFNDQMSSYQCQGPPVTTTTSSRTAKVTSSRSSSSSSSSSSTISTVSTTTSKQPTKPASQSETSKPTSTPKPVKDKGGLSTGAKVAIGVVIPVALIAILLAAFLCLRHRKKVAAARGAGTGAFASGTHGGDDAPEISELAHSPPRGGYYAVGATGKDKAPNNMVGYLNDAAPEEMDGTPAPQQPSELGYAPAKRPSTGPIPSILAAGRKPVSAPGSPAASPPVATLNPQEIEAEEARLAVMKANIEKIREEKARIQKLQELEQMEEQLKRDIVAASLRSQNGSPVPRVD